MRPAKALERPPCRTGTSPQNDAVRCPGNVSDPVETVDVFPDLVDERERLAFSRASAIG